jgi:hypothetical protein
VHLIIYNDDKTISKHKISKELFFDKNLQNCVSYIASSSKEQNALKIFKSHFSDAKSILFDDSNKILQNELENLNIPKFSDIKNKIKTSENILINITSLFYITLQEAQDFQQLL